MEPKSGKTRRFASYEAAETYLLLHSSSSRWHGFLLSCPPLVVPIQADQSMIPVPKQSEYRIAIHCARKVLQLWRHAELIKEYPIEIGKTGTHKRQSGDHRTPIGDYEISWMASRHSEKGHRVIDNKSWCIGNQFVYAPSGPRLEKLWADSYGGPSGHNNQPKLSKR